MRGLTRRQLLVATAGLLAARGVRPAGAAAAAPRGALLADVGAAIDTVVVSVNSARRAALRNAALTTSIINSLPLSTRFLVLTNDPTAFRVEHDDIPGRVTLLALPAGDPITMWPQDPFLVLRHRGGGTLLGSRGFDRADDQVFATAVAAATNYDWRRSSLYFEGGNIVCDGDTAFIGGNTIRYNAVKLGLDEVAVAARFESELGRRVLVIGPSPQVCAHLDMALTPLGRGRVAVADPRAGADAIAAALRLHPESIGDFETRCRELFFGHRAIRELRAGGGDPIEAPPLAGQTARMARISTEVAPVFDAVAGALSQRGYEVARIPFLFGGPESRLSASPGEGLRPGYPMLTYNNVLLERRAGRPTAYLPRYGLDAMDAAAVSAWSKLGFNTVAIDGFATSAMYGGALRCAVKVLHRVA